MPDQRDVLRYTPPPRLKLFGIVAVCAAVVVVAFGLIARVFAAREAADGSSAAAVPVVKIINPSGENGRGALVLPGAIQAFNNAPIYAQVTGYVQRWSVDIGTRVKAGELLAQIDPRSYQAALDQAKGQLARDTATLANAKVDLARYQTLAAQNAVSNQQLAAQQTAVAADAGVVEADQANVQTAKINLGYTRITAPLAGLVTSRSIDVGNFVAVGNASATPLFTVTDESRLRIYVRVPQSYSAEVKPGMTAAFTVPEYPGRNFTAIAQATAGAVDTVTGTVLLELRADNFAHTLKPGDYAQVHFDLHSDTATVRIPSSALMFRDSGMSVAVVAPNGRVTIKHITIAQDFGTSVEVASGLGAADKVIDNPPDLLLSGDIVRVAGPAAHR
ncbi:MAG: efflux RND transporter periplasmic adaptor subunit [Rhizomicrobium sp.]|jgi:RND family efflux transporter MFP subunit